MGPVRFVRHIANEFRTWPLTEQRQAKLDQGDAVADAWNTFHAAHGTFCQSFLLALTAQFDVYRNTGKN